jgi:hypothetical protein
MGWAQPNPWRFKATCGHVKQFAKALAGAYAPAFLFYAGGEYHCCPCEDLTSNTND